MTGTQALECSHGNDQAAAVGTSAGLPAGGYAVARLTLNDYRNYRSERLALAPDTNLVVLTGDNGAGKTNLMEAVSYLSPGRGLRGAALSDITRQGAVAWAVAAETMGPHGASSIGTGLEADMAAHDGVAANDSAAVRRVARQDGQAVSPAVLAAVMQVNWLTPQMDRLFLEGPSARRRFLDRLVMALHPAHGREVAAYERAMRERNRLLAEGWSDSRADPVWLAALEGRMAEHGVAVAAARLDAVARLQVAADMQANIHEGAFPVPDLALLGAVEEDLGCCPAVEVEDRFKKRLAAARARDAAVGRTGDGVHLADFRARHRAKNQDAGLCSTGEQKALLIGIVLAAARLARVEAGAAPVLLLDEVAAHLDARRRAALFDEIGALGAQTWLSGTDAALFQELAGRAQFFRVGGGAVTPA